MREIVKKYVHQKQEINDIWDLQMNLYQKRVQKGRNQMKREMSQAIFGIVPRQLYSSHEAIVRIIFNNSHDLEFLCKYNALMFKNLS